MNYYCDIVDTSVCRQNDIMICCILLYILQMGIKFWKFEKQLHVGFGAPENANNFLFHVFGHVSRL